MNHLKLFGLAGMLAVSGIVCSGDGKKSGGGGSLPTGTVVEEYGYTATDGKLVVFRNTNVRDTFSYCTYRPSTGEQDSLVVHIDSSSTGDTTPYEIVGNKLYLGENDSQYVDDWDYCGNILFQDTSVKYYTKSSYVRVGTGTGLIGRWTIGTPEFVIVAGTMTAEEKAYLIHRYGGYSLSSSSLTLEFTSNKILVSMTYSPAAWFIEDWNQSPYPPFDTIKRENALYAITVTKKSDNVVTLYGNTSRETVTITWNMGGNFMDQISTVYTSDKSGNTPHTYYSNPKSCPNPYEPTWYKTFLTANPKGLAKCLAVPSSINHEREFFKSTRMRELRKLARLNGAFYQ